MSRTRAFLDAKLRARQRPGLDVALLTDAGRGYAASRIGLIGARALLRTAVHITEVWFLMQRFPLEFVVPLFALRAVPGLISGLHWGALEALRARVRREIALRRREAATATVEAYLVLAGAAGALLFSAVVTLVAREQSPLQGPLGLYGLFAIVIAAGVAIEAWTRTYHAGAFALGRVYRPAWTLVAPDLLELAGLVLLFGSIGPFSLHAVVLLGALLRGPLAVIYARRAYRMRGIARPRGLRLRTLARLGRSDALDAARNALATLPMQLDRLLLLSLLQAPAPGPGVLPLAMPYYALRPIAAFAQSWTRTFYPDFVRLDAFGLGVLRARFERLLGRVALVAGALSAAALCAGAYALFGAQGLSASALLIPLALLRSRFALEQITHFAYGAHAELAVTGVVLLSGLVLAEQVELSDRGRLLLVTFTLLGALLLRPLLARRARKPRSAGPSRLPLSAWLHAVSTLRAPVRVSVARVDLRIAHPGAVLQALAGALAPHGQVARAGQVWLLFAEPLERARPRSAWARELAGALAELHSVTGATGAEALQRARAERLLPGDLAAALALPCPDDPRANLAQSAARLVPDAESIDLRAASRRLHALPRAQLALVRRAILAQAREQHHLPHKAAWHVAVFAPAGEPELVFVWPSGAARGAELRIAVRHATWRASLGQDDAGRHSRTPR